MIKTVDYNTDFYAFKPLFEESVTNAYPKAVKFAIKETGLVTHTFLLECPYSLKEILDEDFYPQD